MVIVRFSRVWRAVLGMGHPLVRWSLQMMTQDEGMTAQLQGDHEGGRSSTTKLGGMWKNCVLRIDTLYLEGIYRQKVMRFSQLISWPKNILEEDKISSHLVSIYPL